MSHIITNAALEEPEEEMSAVTAQTDGEIAPGAPVCATALITELQAGENAFNELGDTLLRLRIQAENLTAARTRLVDMDIAMDMARFVKSRLREGGGVDRLVQPCNTPRMAMALMGH